MRIMLGCLLFALLLPLSGCGYHLRGKTDLSPQLKQLAVLPSEDYSLFAKRLRRSLKHNGVKLHKDKNQQAATLHIVQTQFDTTAMAYGPEGQVYREKETLTVKFDLLDKAGKTLLANQQLQLSRIINTNPNRKLGANYQRDQIQDALVLDAVSRLLERLATVT